MFVHVSLGPLSLITLPVIKKQNKTKNVNLPRLKAKIKQWRLQSNLARF